MVPDVKIVNGSTANISGNHEGYGIHANDLLVENSTLTANNNGYGGIRITGKGEFTNSTVTVTGTENKGNASVEITVNKNEHKDKDKYLVGSLSVQNSTLNISDNKATGIACRNRFSCPTSLTIDDASRVTIQNNNATPKNGYNPKGDVGGGLRIEEGSTAVLGATPSSTITPPKVAAAYILRAARSLSTTAPSQKTKPRATAAAFVPRTTALSP